MKIDDLLHMLQANCRIHYANERDLQDGIEVLLQAAGIMYEREHIASYRDRFDFLVDRDTVIEVKINGSFSDLMRQITRYARIATVKMVVVIATPTLAGRLPPLIHGIPIRRITLLGGLL